MLRCVVSGILTVPPQQMNMHFVSTPNQHFALPVNSEHQFTALKLEEWSLEWEDSSSFIELNFLFANMSWEWFLIMRVNKLHIVQVEYRVIVSYRNSSFISKPIFFLDTSATL